MQPGIRTGTPKYMAPEIVRRKPTDRRVDIFAFGTSMYEMFSFELPWAWGADGLAAMSHGASDPPPLSTYCPEIGAELEKIIMACLAGDPAGRPPSMDSVVKALRRIKHEAA